MPLVMSIVDTLELTFVVDIKFKPPAGKLPKAVTLEIELLLYLINSI